MRERRHPVVNRTHSTTATGEARPPALGGPLTGLACIATRTIRLPERAPGRASQLAPSSSARAARCSARSDGPEPYTPPPCAHQMRGPMSEQRSGASDPACGWVYAPGTAHAHACGLSVFTQEMRVEKGLCASNTQAVRNTSDEVANHRLCKPTPLTPGTLTHP